MFKNVAITDIIIKKLLILRNFIKKRNKLDFVSEKGVFYLMRSKFFIYY